LTMRVLLLDSVLEPLFWEHINRDLADYYFIIRNMKRDRASTEIWMALSEQNRIEGMLMIYRNSAVQLRGSVDAVKVFLNRLNLDKAEIQCETEHSGLILNKYKNIRKASEIVLMTLHRGEETLQTKQPTARLSASDAEGIATLMGRENPDWWGDTTAELIASRMDQRLWLGIKVNGRLVSAGGAAVDDWASNIGTVVTDGAYRNRGYATTIVSALVEQILQRSDLSLIHVESNNKPAMRVYTKVGFRPYKKYFLTKAEK
jgi:ribosomal protein S18 acetylase RimI-like enzyme